MKRQKRAALDKFLLAAFFIFISYPAHADEGASDIIPRGGTLRGFFAEDHYFKSASKPLHSEGHFLVAPAHGIIWDIEKPIPFSFIVTPDGATQALGPMVLVQTPKAKMPLLAEVTAMVTATFGGDWRPLEDNFIVARKSTARHWDVTVTPKPDSKMPFQSLSFAGNKHIDSARALRANGGFDKFTFSDQKVSGLPPTAAEMTMFKIAAIPHK